MERTEGESQGSGTCFKGQKKRTVSPESPMWRKYPSGMKEKPRHSQIKGN